MRRPYLTARVVRGLMSALPHLEIAEQEAKSDREREGIRSAIQFALNVRRFYAQKEAQRRIIQRELLPDDSGDD